MMQQYIISIVKTIDDVYSIEKDKDKILMREPAQREKKGVLSWLIQTYLHMRPHGIQRTMSG